MADTERRGYHGAFSARIDDVRATCMNGDPHDPHQWAYTSEGGGHMVQVGYPDSREWSCPGRVEPAPALPAPMPSTTTRGRRHSVLALVRVEQIRWGVRRGNSAPVLVHSENHLPPEKVARRLAERLNNADQPTSDGERWHVVRKISTGWEER